MAGRDGWMARALALLCLVVWFVAGDVARGEGAPDTNSRDDAFIQGYAAAILEREFEIPGGAVSVSQGLVTVSGGPHGGVREEKLRAVLTALKGVRAVRFESESTDLPQAKAVAEPSAEVLPRGRLFAPLMADPKWPHFSAAYQYYNEDDDLDDVHHVGATSFGETFVFYRAPAPANGQWEIGLQAGVFSIFDLAAESTDLINSDFVVGIPVSYRRENFSSMARVYHQSSHLGDEYILGNRVSERVNLSFEVLDLLLSYDLVGLADLLEGFRVYGGGGGMFRKEPADMEPWLAQAGVEYVSPTTIWDGKLRPVAGVDLQASQERDWQLSVSARGGVQLENPMFLGRTLQLLLEYYRGSSTSGQFFEQDIESIGFGFHFHYY